MRKKIQKITALALALLCVISALPALQPAASAATSAAKNAANALYDLGLFKGVGSNADGTPNFDLDSPAMREVAATILVRIIGKETEALAGSYTMPFSDMSQWARNYVGWAYKNKYINGTSNTTFSGTVNITAQQYITLLLRAMGYSDAEGGEFTYAGACAFAKSIGLTDGSYTNSTKNFTRGDIAIISYSALGTKVNGSSKTLYEKCFGKSLPAAESDTLPSDAQVYVNKAPGTDVSTSANGSVTIDYSNCKYGYVMVSTTVSGSPKIVVMVTGPDGVQYKYYSTDTEGAYQAFPLTAGSGSYKIGVYKNISGTKYSTLHSATISVTISGANSPFLRPNYFVDYNSSSSCVKYAVTLCGGCANEIEKISKVYDYVVSEFDYDYGKAESVTTGYRPVLNTVWKSKTGICFDYAATMTAMLRTQGIPTKLVVGYAGTSYHAWISVYTKETGWVEAVIYFNGTSWKFMDPTFASTGGSSVTDYITNDKNYSAKYIY